MGEETWPQNGCPFCIVLLQKFQDSWLFYCAFGGLQLGWIAESLPFISWCFEVRSQDSFRFPISLSFRTFPSTHSSNLSDSWGHIGFQQMCRTGPEVPKHLASSYMQADSCRMPWFGPIWPVSSWILTNFDLLLLKASICRWSKQNSCNARLQPFWETLAWSGGVIHWGCRCGFPLALLLGDFYAPSFQCPRRQLLLGRSFRPVSWHKSILLTDSLEDLPAVCIVCEVCASIWTSSHFWH